MFNFLWCISRHIAGLFFYMVEELYQMTDTERLDWLEKNQGVALVSDDDRHWAVVVTGMQNVPEETPADIETTFIIEQHEWRPTIREAIDAAIEEENEFS